MFNRKARLMVFSSIAALLGLLGVVGALAAAIEANTPDVQIVKVDRFTSDGNGNFIEAETVTAATVLPTGGFLALTRIRSGGSLAYKISNDASRTWALDELDHAALG
ncbi:MAG TPA: hypothetical protein VIY68_18680 [Steroidobacteraceae bacterium]